MGGSSAPAGASGVPSNTIPTAEVYQPTGQPSADISLQSIFGGFTPTTATYTGNNPIFTGLTFPNTPGGNAYAYGNANFTGAGTVTDPNNPYVQSAISTASGLISPYSSLVSQLQGLTGAGSQSTESANTYAGMMQSLLNNQVYPTIQGMYNAANNITGLGGQTVDLGNQNVSLANQLTPSVASILGNTGTSQVGNNINTWLNTYAPQDFNQAQATGVNLSNMGSNVLNTAFDPQSALFNQLQNQVTQQTQAANAAAGLGGSAYGASNTANTLGNFDINWQNQQLQRQLAGLQGAGSAYSTAQSLLPATAQAFGNASGVAQQDIGAPVLQAGQVAQGVSNLLGQGADLYGTGANLYGTGANLYNSATNQFASDIGQWYAAQQAPLQAAAAQASALGTADQTLNQLAGQPYNIQATQSQNALQTLANLTNIGNQQYVPTQQLANDLQSYLGLGQSASQISGQLGALGQNELLNSAAGIGSALGTGSNLLFGNSLGSSGGLLGAAGLNPFTSSAAGALGSGAADFGGSIGTVGAAAGPTFADAAGGAFGGGDVAAVGAADAGTAGGGLGLSSLLPFGAS
jgi:hypothetical protein